MTPMEVLEWALQDWYHVFLAWLFWAGIAFVNGFLIATVRFFWEKKKMKMGLRRRK